jgi:hypothetical protein
MGEVWSHFCKISSDFSDLTQTRPPYTSHAKFLATVWGFPTQIWQ